MVFLDIYSRIWDLLEEENILENMVSELEECLGKKNTDELDKFRGSKGYADAVLEYGLFNYMHKNKLLIDLVSERFMDSLEEDEKKELLALKESQRKNFTILKKISRNEKDTFGKMLYDFHFKDTDTGDIKIVVSSKELDTIAPEINIRLIPSPYHEIDRYNVIGLIHPPDQAEHFYNASKMKQALNNIEHAQGRQDILFRLSTQLSLRGIDSFEEKNNRFNEQDRKIMRMNKQFNERFKMNLDEFMNNAYELSNDKNKFRDMCEHYLSISDEFKEAIYSTNYIMDMKFFTYSSAFKAFFGFAMEDPELLEKGIIALKKEAKEEFELAQQRLLSLTRERIIDHQKNVIKEKIHESGASKDKSSKDKKERYTSYLRNIDHIKADDINLFLGRIISILTREKELLNSPDDRINIEMHIDFINALKHKSDEIPYLEDAEQEHKNARFEEHEFYNYYPGISDDMYNLIKTLYAAYLFSKKEYRRAYDLIDRSNIEINECYTLMFFVGKVLSLFDDKEYKKYLNHAKKIDKHRYKENLEKFLSWKDSISEDELKHIAAK